MTDARDGLAERGLRREWMNHLAGGQPDRKSCLKRPASTIRIDGELAYIMLTRGHEAVIDAADIDLVTGYNWRARESCRKDGSIKTVYACADDYSYGGRRITFFLHNFIMMPQGDAIIDHIDCNGLNNRRLNLRPAAGSGNHYNSRRRIDNTSGVKGVWWSARDKKWRSAIRANGKRVSLGNFSDIESASAAYARASEEMHSEFGRTA